MTLTSDQLFTVYHARAGEALSYPIYVVTRKAIYCGEQGFLDTPVEVEEWQMKHIGTKHPRFYNLYSEHFPKAYKTAEKKLPSIIRKAGR